MYYRVKGNRHYELTNHLGNVLVVVTDRKIAQDTTADATYNPQYFLPDIYSVQNYYAFGQDMPKWSTSALNDPKKYRFGFNGKEDDDEWAKQDYGFRIYDGRVARFLSVDPLMGSYPELTTYQFASNTPIQAIDLDGLEAYFAQSGDFLKWGKIKGEKAPVIVVNSQQLENKIKRPDGNDLTVLDFINRANAVYGESGGKSLGVAFVLNNEINKKGDKAWRILTTRNDVKKGQPAITSENQQKYYFFGEAAPEGEKVNGNYNNFRKLLGRSQTDKVGDLTTLNATSTAKDIQSIRGSFVKVIESLTTTDLTGGASNWCSDCESYVGKTYGANTKVTREFIYTSTNKKTRTKTDHYLYFYQLLTHRAKKDDKMKVEPLKNK